MGRRLRALPRDSRARGRAAVDRVAGGAAAPRARRRSTARGASWRARCCSTSTCSGSRPRSGARRAQRAHGVALFGDLPFMVDGDSADVWARQDQFRLDVSVGAPPDAFSATGQDWGMPVYRWDVIAAERLPLAARARAPQRRSVRRLPRRSPRRLLSHLRLAAGRQRAVLHAGRRSRRRSRSANGCSRIFREAGVGDHRRGSRHRARFRPRVARAPRRSRLPRASAGSATGTPRASRSAIPPTTPPSRSPRPARTTPSRWPSGGSTRPGDERAQVAALPTVQRLAGGHGSGRRRRTIRRSATCCSRRCSRRARTCCCCRVQDVFGWRDRINEPATVNDDNWTFRLPWPSIGWTRCRAARERPGRRCGHGLSGCAPRCRRRVRPWSDACHDDIISAPMATLHPFRALRPDLRRRRRIAAVPYDVVNTDEARALADGNPLSFLRVSRAEIELPPDTDPYSDAVYERAGDEFRRRCKNVGARRRGRAEPLPLPPAHGHARADGPRRVLFARRVRPRRHQEARADAARQGRRPHAPHAGARRADRPGVPDVSRQRRRRSDRRARHGRDAAHRLRGDRRRAPHAVARRTAPIATRSSRRSRRIPALYIADGHHRAASAARARAEMRDAASPAAALGDGADASTFLAVAFPHNQVQILPYNRIVKDLGGLSPAEFLRGGPRPLRRGDRARRRRRAAARSRCTSGRAGTRLRPRACGRIRRDRDRRRSTSACCRTELLAPVLKIVDVRTDKRIDFVGGARGTSELERLVDSGTRGGRVFAVSGQRRRPDGGVRRRRDHAAQEHLVRAEAAGRPADSRDLMRPLDRPDRRGILRPHDHRSSYSTSPPARRCCPLPVLEEIQRDLRRAAGRRHVDSRDQPSLEDVRGDSGAGRSRHPDARRHPVELSRAVSAGRRQPAVLDGADEPAGARRQPPTTSTAARGRTRRSRRRRRSGRSTSRRARKARTTRAFPRRPS